MGNGKYLFSILICFLLLFVFSPINVQADNVCYYQFGDIDESYNNSLKEGNDYYDKYIRYLTYAAIKKCGIPEAGVERLAYHAKNGVSRLFLQMMEEEHLNFVNTSWSLNPHMNYQASNSFMQYMQGNLSDYINYDVTHHNMAAFEFGVMMGGEVLGDSNEFRYFNNSWNTKYKFSESLNSCPTVMRMDYSIKINSSSNFYLTSKVMPIFIDDEYFENGIVENYLFDENLCDLSSNPEILMFSNQTSGNYNMNVYYEGKSCLIDNYSDDFSYLKYDIDSIFNSYLNSGFDYKKIYLDISNSSADVDFKNSSITEEIMNLPYFKGSNSSQAIDAIKRDLEVLEGYSSNIIGCLNSKIEVFQYNGNVKNTNDWLEKYDSKGNSIYVNMMVTLLKKLLDNPNIIDTIAGVKKDDEIKDYVSDLCKSIPETDARIQCMLQQCKSIDIINCRNLASITDYSGLNVIERQIYDGAVNQCKTNGESCIISTCENLKLSMSVNCPAAIKGESEAQKKLESIIDGIIYDLIGSTGVKIHKGGICNLLYDEEKGLGLYIYGGLNLIRIASPILIIILTALDGIKMIASSKEDEQKKFFNHLKVRIICLVLLYLIPTIIKFLLETFVENGICFK